jgi:diaminopimelate decarboxylase
MPRESSTLTTLLKGDGMLIGDREIDAKGRLLIGGADALELAREFGTPLYVFDEEAIRRRAREYRESFSRALPGGIVAFASKAFLSKAMAALAAEEGLHVDTASVGELHVALAGGVRPETITFHGNFKKEAELDHALRAGVGTVVLDNTEEMETLSRVATAMGRVQRALLRVAPGIDAHTLDAISTGRNDTKFGITVENGAALAALEKCLALPGIALEGLHAHIGSQILTLDPYELLVDKLCDFAAEARARTGWTPAFLGLGGGLGIRYSNDDRPPSVESMAHRIGDRLRLRAEEKGIPIPRVGVEPGRSIVGDAGVTLYTVGPVKVVPTGDGSTRTYVPVDGGLSDNPRPLMYGASYEAILANRPTEAAAEIVRVAGRHCETDTLFDARLPLPRSGDTLAVFSTGAYNHVMASNYNSFTRPPVVFVRRGKARLVVRRETLEDLLRRDVG